MSIRNLDKILRPRSVVVVGASERASSVGTTVIRNLSDAGFDGPVFPVNPKYERVFGKQAYAGVGDLPETADLAVICTPARTVPGIVRECGRAGIPGLVILSAGFREAGDEGARLEAEVEAARREFDGMRIVGPNCLGLMVPHGKLNASFAGAMPAVGRVAFVSQSGAVCTSVLDRAAREGVGFSVFDSVLGEGHDVLTEEVSKSLLAAYGIPVTQPQAADSPDEAVRVARQIGYPVAIKILSPEISHKTDVGGVELNVAGDDEVRSTFEKMIAAARRNRPDARVDGVTVQRMVSVPRGCEMIVGAKRDPVFGSVLMVGAGGTRAELFKDRVLELPPLSERLARRMLRSLQTWPLLAGYPRMISIFKNRGFALAKADGGELLLSKVLNADNHP